MRWSYGFVFVRAFVRVCKTKTGLGLPQRPLFNNDLKSPSLKNSNLTCWHNYASQFKGTKPNDSDVTCYDSSVTEAKADVSCSGQLMYIARLNAQPPPSPSLWHKHSWHTLEKKKKKIRHLIAQMRWYFFMIFNKMKTSRCFSFASDVSWS